MDPRALTRPVIQDREALQEFAEAFADHAPLIERDIGRLKRSPDDREAIATLFRAVHNVKGDAALCRLEAPVAVVHPIESVLARVRAGEIRFTEPLAELILLAFDRLELLVEALVAGRTLDSLNLPQLVSGLDAWSEADPGKLDRIAADVIEAVTGFRPAGAPAAVRGRSGRIAGHDRQAADDMKFFRSLALQFEARSPLFRGRTGRVLRLALETNGAAERPVDDEQLEAAVYVHDIGMMFLPESVWLKVGQLSEEDRRALREHPAYAAGLLQRMPGWEVAAEMVLQHHEMPGGAGYPGGLKNGSICAGAKVLGIVDAFEAVMLKHSARGRNRSVLRAVAEINANQSQFAPEWIAPFNQVIRRILEPAE